MEAEPDVLAASVESTSEKKVWPELALREESVGLKSALNPLGSLHTHPMSQQGPIFPLLGFLPPHLQGPPPLRVAIFYLPRLQSSRSQESLPRPPSLEVIYAL